MTKKQAEARLKYAMGAFVTEMLAVLFDEEAPKQVRHRKTPVLDREVSPEAERDAQRALARIL